MNISKRALIFSAFLLLAGINVHARKVETGVSGAAGSSNGSVGQDGLRAGCAAPNASIDMAYNSVRARIHTGGDMWMDLALSNPVYEVPKGSGQHSIFSGALWMGGVDVNGQLKLAAQRFREKGNDYWPGPLTVNVAEVTATTCQKYDKHYVITRKDVIEFNAWYEMNATDPAKAALEFPGYTIPDAILNWPAHNDISGGSYNLAPFYDNPKGPNGADGDYNPEHGDYPLYEIQGESYDCKTTRIEKLYGDFTIWWVFNDKGNIHSETGGTGIGMEIHGQGFSFATNDEINNMTFYNYALINRSTFTLTNTYFGVWVDSDLGFYDDDFVGCDVQRGLGYCYNGKEIDAQGNSPGPGHYGIQPPAVGVDFFEGPYQDNDNEDNPLIYDYNIAIDKKGIPYSGIGIGYGDGIADNERFGMRRFLYHNKGSNPAATGDPTSAADYYNYLRGIWRDGTKMVYGGNGHLSSPLADPAVTADFMFPGETDPLGFGTKGVPQRKWTEETENNVAFDRRFAQSAGPFTLTPGAVNDITVGVVWARALAGGPFASVEKLKIADDKAQALFDNCFRILDGPQAPDVAVKELDRELVLVLSNKFGTNNYQEKYDQVDFRIPASVTSTIISYVLDTATGQYDKVSTSSTVIQDRNYKFQGYLVYQLSAKTVTPEDLGNPSKARLVSQCDIKDGVSTLVNYTFDDALNASLPDPIVIEGADKGIFHSLRVVEDKFAQGDKKLVNFKKYYYMVVAYAYNNFKTFNPNDPTGLDGQKKPYLLSRMNGAGGAITVYEGIPHNSSPKGTSTNSNYGDGPVITRKEGQGNGGLVIDLSDETVNEILANNKSDFPVYLPGKGPINVKVVDPLSVKGGVFQVKVYSSGGNLDTAKWTLSNVDAFEIPGDKVYKEGEYIVNSDQSIKINNEQIVSDLGISISIAQSTNPGATSPIGNGFLEASGHFSDNSKNWLIGIPDADGNSYLNWIRSGNYEDAQNPQFNDYTGRDANSVYEKVLGGTWAPYGLTSYIQHGPAYNALTTNLANLNLLRSVNVYITADTSKWTRCPVIENQIEPVFAIGGAKKNHLRKSLSVGKNGLPDGTGTGMGWFPGYAISLESGERLNMAFSEDSWMAGENGHDMIWNPSSTFSASPMGVPEEFADLRLGGKHFVYVFGNESAFGADRMPAYDQGKFAYDQLFSEATASLRNVWRSCMWVGFMRLVDGKKQLETDVLARLRVSRAYEKYTTSSQTNNNEPLYQFSLGNLIVVENDAKTMETALDNVNIVPNPYYSYSEYETNQLDNRVKLVNLPPKCQISIYTSNGTLIRKYNKSDPSTFLDWDLKNHAGILVAGGVYMIHINVDGIGEKVIKWFGVLRPVDLSTF